MDPQKVKQTFFGGGSKIILNLGGGGSAIILNLGPPPSQKKLQFFPPPPPPPPQIFFNGTALTVPFSFLKGPAISDDPPRPGKLTKETADLYQVTMHCRIPAIKLSMRPPHGQVVRAFSLTVSHTQVVV